MPFLSLWFFFVFAHVALLFQWFESFTMSFVWLAFSRRFQTQCRLLSMASLWNLHEQSFFRWCRSQQHSWICKHTFSRACSTSTFYLQWNKQLHRCTMHILFDRFIRFDAIHANGTFTDTSLLLWRSFVFNKTNCVLCDVYLCSDNDNVFFGNFHVELPFSLGWGKNQDFATKQNRYDQNPRFSFHLGF